MLNTLVRLFIYLTIKRSPSYFWYTFVNPYPMDKDLETRGLAGILPQATENLYIPSSCNQMSVQFSLPTWKVRPYIQTSFSMEVATINAVLGQRAGVLRLVFKLLPPRDLKNVVLVCRLWREVGEAPRLWAWVVLRVNTENTGTRLEVLASRRMGCVRVLDVQEHLPRQQLELMEPILTAISQGYFSLKKLHIQNINLSTLEPSLLAGVARRLEEVWMDGTQLTSEQAAMVMTALCVKNSRLKMLDISCNDLSEVEPSLLARAVNGLEEVDLNDTKLTVEAVEEIISGVDQADTKLKKLNMSNAVDGVLGDKALFTQTPDLLAKALNKLEEVEIAYNNLTSKQIEAILSSICQKKSNMKKLNMSCNKLSSLDPFLLATAVSRLEEVKMDGAGLTTKQAAGIMFAISSNFTTLKHLVVSDNNLSKIPPYVLAKAVNKLEEVNMNNSQLTLQQMEAILMQGIVGTSLKVLCMTEPLDEGWRLDEDLIGKATLADRKSVV